MRKIVALVVALTVVFSSMSFAFAAAPSDVAGDKYEGSILKLMSLGIINGYQDGTFKPGDSIKRCEFAKLMCVALGLSDAATGAKNSQVFNDVKTDHWAAGFVAVAYRQGIIKGVGNGNFDPEAMVTYEQVVTMIVRALGKGYDKMSDVLGGYPVGYLAIAAQEKITDNTDGVPGTPAKRGLVAKLLDNSLEVKWMGMGVADIDSTGKVNYKFEKSTDTILSKGLHLLPGKPEIKDYNTTNKTVEFVSDIDNKRVYKYVEPINPTNTKHCQVTVWVKDGVVYSFTNDTTVKGDVISKVNDSDTGTKAVSTLESLTLKVDGSLYNVATRNNVLVDDSTASVSTVADLKDKFAKVYIKDSKIYRVEAFNVINPGLIAEATASKIKYQKYNANDVYLSNIDSATDLLYVFIDGAAKTVADLKAEMFIKSWTNGDGKKMVIAARSTKLNGKLESYSKDTATIAGTKYDTVGNNYADTGKVAYISVNEGTKYEKEELTDLSNQEVVAYKGLDDKIAFIKGKGTSSSTDFIGMIKNFKKEAQIITLIKDVKGVSTEADYSVKTDSDDLKNGSTTATESAVAVNAAITWNNFLTNDMENNAGDKTSTNDPQKRIYKFFINSDNKITKIERKNFETGSATVTKFNKDTDRIETTTAGSIYVDGTVFFDLKDNKVRYWKDIEGSSTANVTLNVAKKSNGVDGDVVAFTGNTYKFIQGTDKFYAYVKEEGFSDPYYTMTSGTGDALKVHKDDISSFKQIDKEFISYVKDGDKVKLKTVTKAAYEAVYGFLTLTVDLNDTTDLTTKAIVATGTFVNKDGNTITVTAKSGNSAADAALTAGTDYNFKLDPTVKVTKLTIKTDGSNGIDTASVQDATDIQAGDKVALVMIDGSVKMVYYKR